jgi:predicted phage terminase large subunit-like protein
LKNIFKSEKFTMNGTLELKKMKLLAREAKRKLRARTNLADFIKYTYAGYEMIWFHELVCYYLDELLAGRIKKLMIFIPPQHGKSEISSRRFPAFAEGRNPDLKLGVFSYSQTMASTFNRNIQNIIDSPEYNALFPETTLTGSQYAKVKSAAIRNSEVFEIIGHSGFVKTVGVGGGITGTPLDLAIIDDPFKDRKEANSEVTRKNVWEWYQDAVKTRLHNDSKELMLFTRWHEDDLAGRILDPDNEHYNAEEASEWTVIALPALKELEPPIACALRVNDPRQIDEALWPDKHAAEKYKRRREINPTGFNSLDQQRPSAPGGNKFKAEYFPIVKRHEVPFNIDYVKADFFVDGAYTESTKNDATGLFSCYFHKQTRELYVFNAIAIRKELAGFLDFFKPYTRQQNWRNESAVFIEPKASGKDMRSMLQKIEYGAFNAIEIPDAAVKLGKWNRAELGEPIIMSNRVKLVEGEWNKAFLDEVGKFPNGTHDDMFDCLCYAIWWYFVREYDTDGGAPDYET